MKKITTTTLNVFLGTFLLSLIAWSASVPVPEQYWMRCCQDRNPKGKRCSDAANKAQCYRACQMGCGDPDSINGKKCRQQCDLNF
jgi:hypothetical protein